MDGSRFDAWTRRGFGAAAGGVAGSLLALSSLPGIEARRGKKKKKRCKKQGEHCDQGKKKCCCGYECRPGFNDVSTALACCRAAGFPAESADECCSGRLEVGRCICKTLVEPCISDRECCSGTCVSNHCEGIPPSRETSRHE